MKMDISKIGIKSGDIVTRIISGDRNTETGLVVLKRNGELAWITKDNWMPINDIQIVDAVYQTNSVSNNRSMSEAAQGKLDIGSLTCIWKREATEVMKLRKVIDDLEKDLADAKSKLKEIESK